MAIKFAIALLFSINICVTNNLQKYRKKYYIYSFQTVTKLLQNLKPAKFNPMQYLMPDSLTEEFLKVYSRQLPRIF